MKSSIFQLPSRLVIILTLLPVFGWVLSDDNPSGICDRTQSRMGWKYVTYRETYRKRTWGFFKKTATRINVRKEYTTQWDTIKVCCTGYLVVRHMPLVCEPVCLSGCTNGRCVRPNVCACNEGYRDSMSPGLLSQCVPDCKGSGQDVDGCGSNGRCVAPLVCECLPGYASPAIVFQGEGHVMGLPCIPQCTPECSGNGYCSAPNDCRCHPGFLSLPYESHVPHMCLPECDRECINGVCVAPNHCSCLWGYVANEADQFVCDPKCDDPCINGECTGANHCDCHHGYQATVTPNVCSPICNPGCVNAECTSPNHCECYTGYEKTSVNSSEVCTPICDPACTNAVCTQPNVCECHDGYGKVIADPLAACFPICDPPCVNGTCTRPNHCECHEGHAKSNDKLFHLCQPICEPACVNAECTAPNQCECHANHTKTSVGQPQICSPICDPPCIEATCDRPNTCKCYRGYQTDPEFPDYKCSPICRSPCGPDAYCSYPNTCTCNNGYVKVPLKKEPSVSSSLLYITETVFYDTDFCQPICEPKCIENATCIRPNVCQCKPGYRSISQSGPNPTECHPICDSDCVNAYCGYPNKCICHEGFKPNSSDPFACEPSCKHDCINGQCIRPNYCECNDGYEKAVSAANEPSADSMILDNMCIPICSAECSSCVAPGQCLCHPGYVLSDNSTNSSSRFCQPLCEPACPNDMECVEPNDCRLQSDYERDQIEPNIDYESSTFLIDIANATNNCSGNGEFSYENETCVCKYGWSGGKCDVAHLCAVKFEVDNDTRDEIQLLKRIVPLNNWTEESDYDGPNLKSAAALEWHGPICKERCRISFLSLTDFENIREKVTYCHGLGIINSTNDRNSTDDHNSTEVSAFESEVENKTIVCFLRAESECNAVESSTLKLQSATYEIVGVCLLFILLASIGLTMYFIYVRRRKNNVTGGLSAANDPIIEWSDSYECVTTADSSTL